MHEWETSYDDWGIVFGVSICELCGLTATAKRMNEECPVISQLDRKTDAREKGE